MGKQSQAALQEAKLAIEKKAAEFSNLNELEAHCKEQVAELTQQKKAKAKELQKEAKVDVSTEDGDIDAAIQKLEDHKQNLQKASQAAADLVSKIQTQQRTCHKHRTRLARDKAVLNKAEADMQSAKNREKAAEELEKNTKTAADAAAAKEANAKKVAAEEAKALEAAKTNEQKAASAAASADEAKKKADVEAKKDEDKQNNAANDANNEAQTANVVNNVVN